VDRSLNGGSIQGKYSQGFLLSDLQSLIERTTGMVTQGAAYSQQYFNEFGSGRYSPPQRGVQVLKPTIISYGGAPKSGNSPGKSNENVSVSS